MGPKPSVVISFENVKEDFYITLLSKTENYGPYQRIEPLKNADEYNLTEEEKITQKFANYKDDFYLIDEPVRCSSISTFSWSYYPPDPFKILIYLVDSEAFIETEVMERYAFDSYYVFDFDDYRLEKNYDYTKEIISFAIRVILTVAIELIIALLFGYKDKMKLILMTNIITQTILNLLVNYIHYKEGAMAVLLLIFVPYLLIPELIVLIIEIIVYAIGIKRKGCIWYAIIANVVSFFIGLFAAIIVPALF